MEFYRIPGVSIAMIDKYQIDWVQVWAHFSMSM